MTTIFHQVLSPEAKGGDQDARATLIDTIIEQWPQAARIANGNGTLPLHVMCMGNVKIVNATTKERLILKLIHANPDALTTTGGDKRRTPLHNVMNARASHRLVGALLSVAPQAAKMKDIDGRLPIHIGCGYHCSVDNLMLLLRANPSSLRELNLLQSVKVFLTLRDALHPAMLEKPNASLILTLESLLEADEENNPGVGN